MHTRLVVMVAAVGMLAGCALDRTGIGAGSDADVPGPDGGSHVDAHVVPGDDAGRDDGGLDDAGGPDDGGPGDAGLEDGGPPDGGPLDAGRPPTITSSDYTVVAHGGRVRLIGTSLSAVTAVRIGGIAQMFTVRDDATIDVVSLADSTPLGPQSIDLDPVAPAPGAPMLTVIRLVIDELDEETQSGTDTRQFVEIGARVPSVLLTGYTLVLFGSVSDTAYAAYPLTSVDASGRLLIGNAGVTPTPASIFPDETLGLDGNDAIAIYQGPFAVGGAVTTTDLIDALVYSRGSFTDAGLASLLVAGSVVNESTGGGERTNSIQRCSRARRDGRSFVVAAATPGAPNACPP